MLDPPLDWDDVGGTDEAIPFDEPVGEIVVDGTGGGGDEAALIDDDGDGWCDDIVGLGSLGRVDFGGAAFSPCRFHRFISAFVDPEPDQNSLLSLSLLLYSYPLSSLLSADGISTSASKLPAVSLSADAE